MDRSFCSSVEKRAYIAVRNLFLRDVHTRVQTVLRMAEYLSAKYHVVVANPPYMGISGLNNIFVEWADDNYPDSLTNTFSMFIESCCRAACLQGFTAMVTMQGWLFLSSFDTLRDKLLTNFTLRNLIQIGYNSFPEMNSKVAQAAAFVYEKSQQAGAGVFFNLNDAPQSADKSEVFHKKKNSREFFMPDASDFRKIPGSPISYWATHRLYESFVYGTLLQEHASIGKGLDTGDNARFLRNWQEVSRSEKKWLPCQKGGPFRKWYGNNDIMINWGDDGEELREFDKANLRNEDNYFKSGITWTRVSSSPPAFRSFPAGQIFESTGPCAFPSELGVDLVLGLLNSIFAREVLRILAPTLDFQSGHISKVPVANELSSIDASAARACVGISKTDWDSYETSWDFRTLPLLSPDHRQPTLADTYAHLRAHWRGMTDEMKRLEEENNRIFIAAYGLQDELTPEVPLEEITLTCNPAYRYGGNRTDAELEALLHADTMREFVSYAVGCMFGRYSLDAPGLILASQRDGLAAYLARVPKPTFAPVADNVIPVLDGDWFADDIAARFRTFLRVTFGDARFADNLAFVEDTLGKDVRKYFVRDFFNDHINMKRYKKRPIYWLFSSPKGTFNALIYMHRYRPDTASTVLQYLRDFRGKLETHRRVQETQSISSDTTAAQKTKAVKAIEALRQQIEELDAWERDVLFPLASQRIEIDLDDGVKANYPKFGTALRPIKGLNDADD